MRFLLACFIAFLAFPIAIAAQERPRTILVLDASGSMWGQIEGRTKIEIAQDVVGGLLDFLPERQELGLTVYGHRTEGDCTDIETLVHPGLSTRDAISRAVKGIKPRGRTPMTDAVVAAAKDLGYTEQPATVILVSDGIETCNPDPCAAARALEESGVDFTAHVVGFDVNDPTAIAQMQCLAKETGGRFLSADDADELGKALTEVAVIAPEPEPTPVAVTFVATEGNGGPVITSDLLWTLSQLDTVLMDFERGASVSANLLPGAYSMHVLRPEDEANAMLDFTIGEAAQTVTLVLPELLPAATLDATESAVAGSTIPVEWTGPNAKNDYISVARPGDRGYETFVYTNKGTPGQLVMPPLPGSYELRYVMSDGRKVLATRSIEVTEAAATLDANESAPAGSTLTVTWTGPDYKNDYISVARTGDRGYENFAYTHKGDPAQVLMPPIPGTYELRYVMNQDRTVLATRQIVVTPVEATLEASDTATVGQTLDITWTGPDYKNDYISVARQGDKGYENFAYTHKGDPAAVVMPSVPGTYELRYVMNQDRTVLATKQVRVSEVTATLDAPATATAGEPLSVGWTGPDYKNDYISVARPGDTGYEAYAYTHKGTPATVKMPLVPGAYELRYVMNQDRTVLVSQPITIVEVGARLDIPEAAPAGSNIVVTWEGPGYERDYISVARPGDPKYDTYTYTREGSPLILTLPTTPGDYEIRYVAESNGTSIIARAPITLTEINASVRAAQSGAAGGTLAVYWEGPDYRRDFIGLSRAGASDSEYDSYVYTSEDSPMVMKLPETPGDYEIRYYLGQGNKVIARQAVTVE